jgi:hypothetical protein
MKAIHAHQGRLTITQMFTTHRCDFHRVRFPWETWNTVRNPPTDLFFPNNSPLSVISHRPSLVALQRKNRPCLARLAENEFLPNELELNVEERYRIFQSPWEVTRASIARSKAEFLHKTESGFQKLHPRRSRVPREIPLSLGAEFVA